MSSREIADLCEKRHPDVRRDINAVVRGLGDDVSRFARIYKDAAGRQQEEYNLPKDLTLTLVAGYNVVLRKRIIDRWLELEGQGAPAMLIGPQLMAAALFRLCLPRMVHDPPDHFRPGWLRVQFCALGIQPSEQVWFDANTDKRCTNSRAAARFFVNRYCFVHAYLITDMRAGRKVEASPGPDR